MRCPFTILNFFSGMFFAKITFEVPVCVRSTFRGLNLLRDLELTVRPGIYISLYNGKMATVPHSTNSTAKSSDTVTELLWKDALCHLKHTNNEVLLPTNVRDMIGQDNVDKIKSRLG